MTDNDDNQIGIDGDECDQDDPLDELDEENRILGRVQICGKCNTQNRKHLDYCDKCGRRLSINRATRDRGEVDSFTVLTGNMGLRLQNLFFEGGDRHEREDMLHRAFDADEVSQ